MKDVGLMHETLSTEGWQSIKSLLHERMDGAMRQLASVTRPAVPSDEALRGLISGLNWVLDLEERVNRALSEVTEEQQQQAAEESGSRNLLAPDA